MAEQIRSEEEVLNRVTSSRRIKSERVRHRRKKESKSKLLESGDSSPAVVVSLADIEQAPDLRDTLFCEEDLVKEVSAISATQAEASEKHKEDKEREKRERKEREKKEKEKEKQEKKERKEKEKEKKKAKTKKGDEDGEADKEKSSKSSFSEDSSSSGSEDSKEKKKKKKKTFLYPLHPERSTENPLDLDIFKPVEIPISCTRDRIANEILTTEQNYVRSMHVLTQVFKDPMAQKIDEGTLGLTEANFHTIFSNVEDIIVLNQRFLTYLRERLVQWSGEQQIGDIFVHVADELKLYTTYSLSFEEANKVLSEYEKKEKNAQFLEKLAENPLCLGLEFSAFLIMPIQRIPRYNLLISELIKQTPDEHPDMPNLQRGLEAVKAVALEINEAVREAERQARLNKIARKFLDAREKTIRTPGRHFYHDGELTKVCRKDTKVRHFFLFSDCFINAQKMGSDKFTISRQLQFSHLKVEDCPDDKYKNAIAIRHEERSFLVYADSPLAKSQWLAAFKQALGESLETQTLYYDRLAPLWMPDDFTKVCLCCEVKFTTFNRRHHCRQCGIVVCGKCSNNEKYLAGKGKKVRVCTKCYKLGASPEDAGAPGNVRADGSDSSSHFERDQILFECTALYNYKSETPAGNSAKLFFKAGDSLGIILPDDSGWWLADLKGQRGWVPSNFLHQPSPEEIKA